MRETDGKTVDEQAQSAFSLDLLEQELTDQNYGIERRFSAEFSCAGG
jgi:hypothetical protein